MGELSSFVVFCPGNGGNSFSKRVLELSFPRNVILHSGLPEAYASTLAVSIVSMPTGQCNSGTLQTQVLYAISFKDLLKCQFCHSNAADIPRNLKDKTSDSVAASS